MTNPGPKYDAMAAYRAQVAKAVRRLELLRRLEWAGYVEDETGVHPACPWCGRAQDDGHADDCELAVELAVDPAKTSAL
jgi:hypothetical protein